LAAEPRLDLRWLRIALGFWGIGFTFIVGVGAFTMSLVSPYMGAEYDQMLQAVYFVLGLFLMNAARDPLRHLSLIRFTIWSSVVHGGLMVVQAILMRCGRAHCADPTTLLVETIPLALTAATLGLLLPRRPAVAAAA
jgi:hypothetical protein